jgi:hypothetical protein
MTQPQFHFLLLACGAFVALGVALAISTVQYWSWKRRTGDLPPAKKH